MRSFAYLYSEAEIFLGSGDIRVTVVESGVRVHC